jgi:hypothetical protein
LQETTRACPAIVLVNQKEEITMRRNLLPYSALIVLAPCLLLAPALSHATGNADGPTSGLIYLTIDPQGSHRTAVLGGICVSQVL